MLSWLVSVKLWQLTVTKDFWFSKLSAHRKTAYACTSTSTKNMYSTFWIIQWQHVTNVSVLVCGAASLAVGFASKQLGGSLAQVSLFASLEPDNRTWARRASWALNLIMTIWFWRVSLKTQPCVKSIPWRHIWALSFTLWRAAFRYRPCCWAVFPDQFLLSSSSELYCRLRTRGWGFLTFL